MKEFLWCFDEGMPRVPSYGGVRLSFLLGDIAKLGEQYPAALAALRERRDQAAQRMLADPRGFEAAQEFAALNRTLKEDQNTLAALDQLPAEDLRRLPLTSATDPRRQPLTTAAYDQLILAQRYGDALAGKSYGLMIAQFEVLAVERPIPANIPNPEMIRKTMRDLLISSTAKNIEVLAGAGDLDDARGLARRVLTLDPSPETRALLQKHAVRAGQPDLLNGVPNP